MIAGKRAPPAPGLNPNFEERLPTILRPEDVAMGFSFPEADETV